MPKAAIYTRYPSPAQTSETKEVQVWYEASGIKSFVVLE